MTGFPTQLATIPDVDRPYLDVGSGHVSRITGVSDEDMPLIVELFRVWRKKYPRNLIRSSYYDAHERFKDFGISIPSKIKARAEAMIGWPAKAVRSLADLSTFQGFAFRGDDMFGVNDLVDSNELDVEMSEAITSAYTHSCAFLTVTADEDDATRMRITPRSADWSAALWDNTRRRILAALTITSADKNGRITSFNVWLPGRIYVCTRDWGAWAATRIDTYYPEVNVVPLAYDAHLNRPFGRSRISRTLMSLTDIGFRTIMRMEASAEFYSVPKLWFLGADKSAFSSDTWSSLISAINAISKDEDGDKPEIKQISQASMQPHGDMLKTIALLVSSETNLPISDLGIVTENPTSAEAMAAAERKLSREADRQNIRFGRAIKRAVIMSICLRDGLIDAPDNLRTITPLWAPTREVSDASRADYYAKLASVNSSFATSDVGMMKAGLSPSEIESLHAYEQKIQARQTIQQLKDKTLQADMKPEDAHGTEESAGHEPARSKDAGTAEAAQPGTQGLQN